MSKSEDRRTEIALFRYTLILPLIRGEYPPGGKQALRCLLYTSPSPRDRTRSRMPSSA